MGRGGQPPQAEGTVGKRRVRWEAILPALFIEYLAISLAKGILPGMIVEAFGDWSYHVVGVVDTARGLLAFVASPMFGKMSDKIGRRPCLFSTVLGSTFPVCVLAFTSNLWIYAVFQGLSGFFSATFPLTFAYIADLVDREHRAPAYGLALATLGLSFTIGPVTGGFLAKAFGAHTVFTLSAALVALDLAYILVALPESNKVRVEDGVMRHPFRVALEHVPLSWNLSSIFDVFRKSDLMRRLGVIVFLYYVSVWAIVTTLMVYVVKRLHFSTVLTAWLISALGLSTVFAEGVLVRIIVPRLGEAMSIRIGLASFALQAFFLAFATRAELVFVCMGFSMLSNLVYPSISSIVSKSVGETEQGEALGALNGLRALTEGFGPLVFGALMYLFEDTPLPGAPYLLAAVFAGLSFLQSFGLPSEEDMYDGRTVAEERGKPEARGLLDVDDEDEEEEGSGERGTAQQGL